MTLWPGALQAVCQPLLSPVGPITAPEWERLWITHLYPLQAGEQEEGEEGRGKGEAIGQRVQMGVILDV